MAGVSSGSGRTPRASTSWRRCATGSLLYRSEADGSTLLRSDRIKSLFFDRSGVLWIGALDQGLLAFDRAAGRTTLFRHDPVDPTSLPFDIPWSYCEDSVGRFWVGTQGGGLAQLDRTTGRFVTYRHSESDPASLSDDRVWALLEDRAGRFWVATDRGLDWMDRATGTFTHLRSAPGDPFPLPVNELRYLYEAKDGAIWVSSRNEGLARLDPETGRVKLFRHDEAVPDGVPHNAINAVTEAGSTPGVLWVCTSGGGFLRLDPATGKVRAFRERDGLPNDGTYAALEDAKGFLWISTDTGIARFDPRTESFRRYDQRDGVQGNEFNGKAFGRSPTGELAFGGMDGLNVFRPETIQDDRLVPPVLITDLKVFGRSVDVSAKEGGQGILSRVVYATDEIELSWRDTVFSLEFAALDLATPDRNRYRFKLEGVDEDWTSTDATHRSATYTMLPGGRYLFRVQGTNGDGVWNEEGASLRIRVVPPFWQTSWFRGLVLFSLLVAGLAAHRLRLRAVEARRRELAQKVEERTAGAHRGEPEARGRQQRDCGPARQPRGQRGTGGVRPANRRGREPGQERLPLQHVPRAANAAQCDHRLLPGAHRAFLRQSEREAGRVRQGHPGERPAPALAHQRHPRPLQDRGGQDGARTVALPPEGPPRAEPCHDPREVPPPRHRRHPRRGAAG